MPDYTGYLFLSGVVQFTVYVINNVVSMRESENGGLSMSQLVVAAFSNNLHDVPSLMCHLPSSWSQRFAVLANLVVRGASCYLQCENDLLM
jgi:hypothetical protein